MEISHSLSCKLLHKNLYCSAPILPSRVPSILLSLIPSSKSFSKLVEFRSAVRRPRGIIGPSYASGIRASSADDGERWLLEPVGDGDSRHIGFKVQMPDAFEIASNAVTFGRLPQKADMFISVATVSGLHARIQKKWEYLVVTDLDSTNGTFINEKRLRPGVATVATPGSRIVFGDIHLAMFLVLKLMSNLQWMRKNLQNSPRLGARPKLLMPSPLTETFIQQFPIHSIEKFCRSNKACTGPKGEIVSHLSSA